MSIHNPVGVLTEADHPALMTLLDPVAHRWNDLCLQLGVPLTELRIIEARPTLIPGAPRSYLREGVFEWLNRGSAQQPCTVTNLCNALRANPLDENTLAEQVKMALNNRGMYNSECEG